MSTVAKDWSKRWDNPRPPGLRNRQKLLTFVCLFFEAFVTLWVVSIAVRSGRLDTLEFGIIAVAFEFAVVAFLVAVSIWIYALFIGELLWASGALWPRIAGALLSGAVIGWFIDYNWRLALVPWQIAVLALCGAFTAPVLLALFDLNTKFLISRLYRPGKPLRYYAVSRWNSGPASL